STTNCATEPTSLPKCSTSGTSKLERRRWSSLGRCSHERRSPSDAGPSSRARSDGKSNRAARCASPEPKDAGLPRNSGAFYRCNRCEFFAPQGSNQEVRSEQSPSPDGPGCLRSQHRGDEERDREAAGCSSARRQRRSFSSVCPNHAPWTNSVAV